MKITGKQKAWLTNQYTTVQDIKDVASCGDAERALGMVFLSSTTNDMSSSGWIHVGWADVTFEFINEDQVLQAQVSAINKQIDAVREDANQKVAALTDRLSKLQAITYVEAKHEPT